MSFGFAGNQPDAAKRLPGAQLPGVFSRPVERPGKADFVAVGVNDMEKPLAPRRISRRRLRPHASRAQPPIQPVDIVVIEKGASPPRPRGCLGDQVEIARSRAKARKTGAAVKQL